MTTLADVIHRTRRHLMTGQQDRYNVLDLSTLAGAVTLQMRNTPLGIADGSRLSIGLEEFQVTAVSSAAPGAQATVIPGFDGSPQSAHTAGDLIRVNPHFSDYAIMLAINECINDLAGEGLFRIKDVEFTYQPMQAGYDVPVTDFISVWKVRFDTPGIENDWPVMSRSDFTWDTRPSTADFPGGFQFTVRHGGSAGFPVRVSYKATFDTLTALTDDVLAVTGLHDVAHDLPALGAAIRLLAGREVKRSFLSRQPEPRRQEEVPPGSANQSMESLLRLYATKLNTYKRYLARLYPEQVG